MAELIYRGDGCNHAISGRVAVAVPKADGGFVYVYSDPARGLVAALEDPNPTPPPAPKTGKKAKKAKAAELEGDELESDDA